MESECPIFRPTMEEFSNFSAYIDKLDKEVAYDIGVCKIIPPEGWWDGHAAFSLLDIRVQNAVKQHVCGAKGVFTVQMTEAKSMSISDFKTFADTINPTIPTGAATEWSNDVLLDLERQFWRTLSVYGDPPLYGADMPGSLFGSDHASSWNLNQLDTLLQVAGRGLPGITTSMLYVGMWKAMFAWHTEDMDLHSINYLHAGAPKFWYSIPPKYAARFESLAVGLFPDEAMKCKHFLRHKMSLVSPKRLAMAGIPYSRVLHRAGEFVITFPRSYHSGFNCGFNVAEAVNFASPFWLDYGKAATWCVCRPNSVKIDMEELLVDVETVKGSGEVEKTGWIEAVARSEFGRPASVSGLMRTMAGASDSVGRSSGATTVRRTGGKAAVAEEFSQWDLDMASLQELSKHEWKSEPAVETKSATSYAWTFQCVCTGREIVVDKDPVEGHPVGSQFKCSICDQWSHVECRYPEFQHLASDKLPLSLLCFECNDCVETARNKSKIPLAVIKINDTVRLQHTVGTAKSYRVVDVDDGKVRLHLISNTAGGGKKVRDTWITLGSARRGIFLATMIDSVRSAHDESRKQRLKWLSDGPKLLVASPAQPERPRLSSLRAPATKRKLDLSPPIAAKIKRLKVAKKSKTPPPYAKLELHSAPPPQGAVNRNQSLLDLIGPRRGGNNVEVASASRIAMPEFHSASVSVISPAKAPNPHQALLDLLRRSAVPSSDVAAVSRPSQASMPVLYSAHTTQTHTMASAPPKLDKALLDLIGPASNRAVAGSKDETACRVHVPHVTTSSPEVSKAPKELLDLIGPAVYRVIDSNSIPSLQATHAVCPASTDKGAGARPAKELLDLIGPASNRAMIDGKTIPSIDPVGGAFTEYGAKLSQGLLDLIGPTTAVLDSVAGNKLLETSEECQPFSGSSAMLEKEYGLSANVKDSEGLLDLWTVGSKA